MLDLNFVRDNLPLVEEKLRQRGMDPARGPERFPHRSTRSVASHHRGRNRESAAQPRLGRDRQAEKERAGRHCADGRDQGIARADSATGKSGRRIWKHACRKFWPAFPTCRMKACRSGRPPKTTWKCAVGARRRSSISLPSRTGNWASSSAFSIWNARRNSPARALRFTGTWERDSNGRWPTSCSTCTPREHGYTEVLPPYMVNSESMYGTGQLPKFAADLFRVSHGDKDLWLIPTAEVPVTNLYRDEMLDAARLPVSLYRLHAVLSQRGRIVWQGRARHHPATPVSESRAGEIRPAGTFLRGTGEADRTMRKTVLQKLGLHYRVMALCTGDMGFSSAKTYDIEVWLPGQQFSARFLPARTSKRSRRDAPISATVPKAGTRPSLCTR